jgi:hypothetical protein
MTGWLMTALTAILVLIDATNLALTIRREMREVVINNLKSVKL